MIIVHGMCTRNVREIIIMKLLLRNYSTNEVIKVIEAGLGQEMIFFEGVPTVLVYLSSSAVHIFLPKSMNRIKIVLLLPHSSITGQTQLCT